jgi:hypothetical protein
MGSLSHSTAEFFGELFTPICVVRVMPIETREEVRSVMTGSESWALSLVVSTIFVCTLIHQ